MKKISKRTIGESLRISLKFPSNVSEYSAFSAVLKSTGSDGQKLASFDATSARVDALDLKKYWLDIEAPQTEKASAGGYSLAVSYAKVDPNFDNGDVKKFEVIAFELVDRNTFAGINFDRPIEISIGSSEVIAVTITSEFGEVTACPVSSVNTKTGAVVLNADDIAPTASRGWFTSFLASVLSTAAQWISDVGSPHVTNKNNPHETSFSNVKGYPATPEGKVLTDRGTFDFVSAGGATNLPLYASNADSLAVGYKVLSGSPSATEVIKTITASAGSGVVAGEAHLSATPLGVALIPAGTFEFGYWRAVDNSQGDSFKQVEVFTRSAAGVESSLFTLESSTIDDTELTERVISRTISQSYAVNPAHFLGVRFKFRTTRSANTNLQYIVGGARGWWMRTTLPLKHDDLSDKNGNPDFQHITATEKAKLGKLLVDFTVPTDRLSVDFVATDLGVSFSDLSIRAVTVLTEGYLINDNVSSMLIGINDLYTETGDSKYQLGSGDQAAGFLVAVRQVFSIVSYLYVNGQNCNTVTSNWRATSKNPLTNVVSLPQTGNKFNNCSGKITAVRITCNTAIKAGTNITIYRND